MQQIKELHQDLVSLITGRFGLGLLTCGGEYTKYGCGPVPSKFTVPNLDSVIFVIEALKDVGVNPREFVEAAHKQGFPEFQLNPAIHSFGCDSDMTTPEFLEIAFPLVKPLDLYNTLRRTMEKRFGKKGEISRFSESEKRDFEFVLDALGAAKIALQDFENAAHELGFKHFFFNLQEREFGGYLSVEQFLEIARRLIL